jgi:hypothetical protein
MLFELSIYKKTILHSRFVDRLLKVKLSEYCIFCISRLPDGKIVLDANKRALIIDDSSFEVVRQLDPNDS